MNPNSVNHPRALPRNTLRMVPRSGANPMRRIVLALGLGLLLANCTEARAQNLVMPRELVNYASTNGCRQVDDFFEERVEMVDPPYVYGYFPGDKNDSAVFWCQTDEGGRRKFWLLIMQKTDRREPGGCPEKFEVKGTYPGGLTLSRDGLRRDGLVVTTLDDFHYLSDPRRKPPKGVRIKGNVIVRAYGGIKTLFYCYRGSWVFQGID